MKLLLALSGRVRVIGVYRHVQQFFNYIATTWRYDGWKATTVI